MKHKTIIADKHQTAAYYEVAELMRKHAPNVSAAELLAIAANMVGKILALQDQTTMTRAVALAIVSANIEAGNREAVEAFANSTPAGRA